MTSPGSRPGKRGRALRGHASFERDDRARREQPSKLPGGLQAVEQAVLGVRGKGQDFFGTDPDPGDNVRPQPSQCAMVVADANREPVLIALQSTEVKRRMIRVIPPEAIIFHRELLNVRLQTIE